MNEKLVSNDNGDIDYGQWWTFTNPDAHEYESLPEEMPSPEEKKAELTFEYGNISIHSTLRTLLGKELGIIIV